jgi:mono/diheme cytochrome c family protein
MNIALYLRVLLIVAAVVSCSATGLSHAKEAAAAATISPEQIDFFEKKIRPLLVDRCIDCHAEDANGGLQLDSAAALQRGGASGPVVVPGKPEESRLIHAVRSEKGMKAMPPDDPLSEGEIADLVKWIEMGAADPRTGGGSSSPLERLFERAGDHWALKPIKSPQPPTVKATDLVRTPIDAFIQAALEAKGWSMSPRADGRTLLRRAALDLTGLPPTVAEVDAFAADPSPAVFESTVDRLLESPRYGERWGRHWLDVARYADSQGATFGGAVDGPYPYAYTYRDWVIRAFNEDLPFDRFVTAQLAADLTNVAPDDNRDLAALGFLTVGRQPNQKVDDDAIDDRIDVITRGLLGLSVSCARCHDHKLEAIPTVDYYGLYGVLKSCTEPAVYPAMKPQPPHPERAAYEAENRKARAHYVRVMAFEAEKGVLALRARLGDYLLAVHDGKSKWIYEDNNRVPKEILTPRGLDGGIYSEIIRRKKSWLEAHPQIFRPWLELAALPAEEYDAKAPAMIEAYAANADGSLAKVIAGAFLSDKPRTLADVAQLYNRQAQSFEALWGERVRGALDKLCVLRPEEEDIATTDLLSAAVLRIHEAEVKAMLPEVELQAPFMKALVAEESPFVFKDAKSFRVLVPARDVADGLRRNATTAVNKLFDHPGAPARLMAVQEGKPFDAKVFIRGNPQSLGADAPRQYLTMLRGEDAQAFPKDSSGRKELAALIASPQNPLTARLIVNRVWIWHFGHGLVRTASDFGLQGEPPSHPELLDWLASRFIADGWSLKKLHRLIMQSHVYQQASAIGSGEPAAGSARQLDPENRFFWRYPSRSLEFEGVRDAMIAVGGGLDESVGGKPFDVNDPASRRRTVYAKIDRKQVAPVMRIFDVPDSNFTSPGRSRTALPPQALWLFNSPFAVESAKRLAATARSAAGPDAGPAAIVTSLWRSAVQRNPSPQELAEAEAFISAYPKDDIVQPEADDWSYGFADFDADAKTVKGFTSIDRFAGTVVRGLKTAEFDGTAMEMTPDGGRLVPGKAAVRRWTSPEKGTVKIEAELVHLMPAAAKPAAAAAGAEATATGDSAAAAPIVCRIVHSRHGQLGEWTATSDGVMTKVESVVCEPGDTIDFVALTDLDPAKSGFIWSPTIVMVDRDMPALPGMKMRWDARHDFLDPKAMAKPLGPWEELAQVLLVSGEFMLIP